LAFFGAKGTYFVATDKGVYRSDDQGQTWRIKSPKATTAVTQGFCGGVKGDGVVLYCSQTTGSQIYKSTDLRETWIPALGNLSPTNSYSRVQGAENDPNVLYIRGCRHQA